MNEDHWLIWTSRPAPLKAGLGRIHRELDLERFPAPSQALVSATDLTLDEKALILMRHARARDSRREREIVYEHGWRIVGDEHFTPERIRRFVARALPTLAMKRRAFVSDVLHVVAQEIERPTEAMATSLAAIDAEHRCVLVAMLDLPAGPAPERDLTHAIRRHAPDGGLPASLHQLTDRLLDHFLTAAPNGALAWVHPSWRDVIIDHVAADDARRHRFLERSDLDGLLLAISVAGGSAGERVLPFVRTDSDWDTITDRLVRLAPDLDRPDLLALLAALETGAVHRAWVPEHAHPELDAMVKSVLDRIRRAWDRADEPIDVSLLVAWVDAAVAADITYMPRLARTWIDLVPTAAMTFATPSDVARLADFERLLRRIADTPEGRELLLATNEHGPRELIGHVTNAATDTSHLPPPTRTELADTLRRLGRFYHFALPELVTLADDAVADIHGRPVIGPVFEDPTLDPRLGQDAARRVERIMYDVHDGPPRQPQPPRRRRRRRP
jgi:hypothetical protein